jgi:hypothetical protein
MGQDGWERHRRVGKPAGHVTKVKGARQKAIERPSRERGITAVSGCVRHSTGEKQWRSGILRVAVESRPSDLKSWAVAL